MKAIGALTPVILVLGLAVHAQDTATMTSPVIRTDADEIQFTVDFANFAPDGDYRLGFGSIKQGQPKEADRVKEAKLVLEKSGNVVEAELVDFDQAYTKTWWEEVDLLKMQGFVFGTAPPEGQKLTLRVKVPRKVAESLEAVYIGVSRDYGGGLWYLEDAAKIESSLWSAPTGGRPPP